MKGGHQGTLPPELREEAERRSPGTHHKIEQVWHLLGRLEAEPLKAPGTDVAWADVQQRLDAPATHPRTDRAPRRSPIRRRPRWVGRGLSIAALLVVVAGAWWWQQPIEVVVARGEQQQVTLPDGSTVHLNSDSKLRYTRGFEAWPFVAAAQRVVTLEGEAFFDVVHNATQPFVVETFNGRVEVLGTQFNVRARQGHWEDETQVTLASGRVRVTTHQDAEDAVLLTEAGQGARIRQATISPDSSTAQQTRLQRVLSWRDQEFSFIDKPLAFVLAEIERRFDLVVKAEAGIALTDSVTIFYPRGATADKILHDLCLAQRCRYRETSSGFAVFPAEL